MRPRLLTLAPVSPRDPPSPRVPGLQTAVHDLREDRGISAARDQEGRLRVPFDRERIRVGWRKPVTSVRSVMTDRGDYQLGEREVYQGLDREIPSRDIGELVLAVADVDQVAFVRFASVYRNSRTSTILSRNSSRCSGSGSRLGEGLLRRRSQETLTRGRRIGMIPGHVVELVEILRGAGHPRLLVVGDLVLDRIPGRTPSGSARKLR
ncbi:MAG: hypothetical protein Ct9H300mP1_31440 [Planctomycetaceae bacterium]|nr:MAG: hypothetical protein Ct9H300mP1_31440 [Planctomycetaceae bacterium]